MKKAVSYYFTLETIDELQKQSAETNRTQSEHLTFLIEQYQKTQGAIVHVPVIGKIVDGKVVLSGQFAGSDTERE